jgi:pilus assembly protein CpaF
VNAAIKERPDPTTRAVDIEVTELTGSVKPYRCEQGKPFVIGRDPGCDAVLADLSVSRRHATIEVFDIGWSVSDSSANGTYIGEERLLRSAQTFQGSAELRLGSIKILVRPVEARVTPTPAPPSLDMPVAERRRIHRILLEHLDLAQLERDQMHEERMRPQVIAALRMILEESRASLPPGVDEDRFVAEMTNEVLGLGPLEDLLADETVSEIMVVDPETIYCERRGVIERTKFRFTDSESARAVIERIVSPLGRRIDESTPYVDARLKDGSRVNAIIPPLALRGPCITIRKFSNTSLGMPDLIGFGSLTPQMARFLERSVITRQTILISGGTGSGKTTLLNVLSAAISPVERVITIEDAAELRLSQPHVVQLESKPSNMEGRGAIPIRDLVRNALRMRPDRIIVGECRGGEALDMLQAMNTGHDGSMTTTHANNPHEALARLETLVLMAGLDLPSRAIREQIAASVDLVVQVSRLADGKRRITNIAEVVGLSDEGELDVREIFRFVRTGTGKGGEVMGEFQASGYLPSFLSDFMKHDLVRDGEFI